jgi:hypothetical protein
MWLDTKQTVWLTVIRNVIFDSDSDSRYQSLLRLQQENSKPTFQRSLTSERPDYSPSERRISRSFADRQKFLKSCIYLCSSAPATQRRESRPATHLLPAESNLLPSEGSGVSLRTTGLFQGPHFLIGCSFTVRKLPARLLIQQARTVL